MSDRPRTAGPEADDITPTRRGLFVALGGVAMLGCVIAVLYGMSLTGKADKVGCPAAGSVTARLDPLIHGEVAAFALVKPASAAPELTFNGDDGKPLTLASLKGKTLLVNLWATWCVPCRKEMPSLDKLQAALGGADFAVVAVNVDTTRLDRPKTFLKEAGVSNLAFYADPSGDVMQTLKLKGELLGLPTTLLIDRNGCELGRIAGPAEWSSSEARQLIEAAKG